MTTTVQSAVPRLPWRLSRRGAGLLWLTGAVYMLVEVLSYEATYPDEASRQQLVQLSDNAAVRTLQGVPHAIETTGGFVVWDSGWFLALIVGIWSLLVTTRLLRAEEDTGRSDLVLSRSLTPLALLRAQLGVVTAELVAFGATVGLALVVLGQPVSGSLLFGAGLTGVGLTMVGVAALCSQLFDVRRRAVGAAGGLLGLFVVVRMYANSSEDHLWLLHTTPLGWLDQLRPFAGDRWIRLLPFLLAASMLIVLAAVERARRDTGAARLVGLDKPRPRLRLLGGPLAFGWRLTSGALVSWVLGAAAFGVVMGSMVSAFVELVEEDEGYASVLEQLGVDMSDPVEGFVAYLAVALALVLAFYVSWRIGSLRAEETSGRLEHLLVRPVVRWRWAAGSAALAVAASALVVLATGIAMWAGAAASGTDLGLRDSVSPLLATLPVAVLFCGLAVLAFGVLPRLTIALPVTLAVVAYLLDMIAAVLELPAWVHDLSPFQWLPMPPAEPWTPLPSVVLTLIGVAFAAVGVALFVRRDLQPD